MTGTSATMRTPLSVQLAAVPATVGLVVLGVWLFGAVIAPTYWTAIGFSVAWYIVLSVVLGKLTKGRRDLRRVVRATFWGVSALSIFLFWWTSVRETTVNEKVVVGAPASQVAASGSEPSSRPPANVERLHGSVTSLAHSARGRAAVVELASGERKLTLTGFRIDPGPKVEVRLVAGGDPAGSENVKLGGLKGTRGSQQYRIGRGVSLSRYRRVVFWCIPFSQALAQARLVAS